MNLIVAVDENWGIGAKNDLLYSLKQDMAFFRETTLDKVVVMGRNTLESFPGGNPLKRRVNICVNNEVGFSREGVIVVGSLQELFNTLEEYNTDEVFVIGGASIYRQMLPYCKYAYITKIEDSKPAEVFFPNLDENPDWNIATIGEPLEEDGTTFRFCIYENSNIQKFN